MKQLDVSFAIGGSIRNLRFRTNDDGCNLFVDMNGSNKQICHESGYNNLPRIKRRIREYLKYYYNPGTPRLDGLADQPILPRLKYRIVGNSW